jgi:protein O-mannosyl-transferase
MKKWTQTQTVRASRRTPAAVTPAPPPDTHTLPGRVQLLHALLIAVVAIAVYSNTVHNEFHLDDFFRVVDNPGIQRVAPVWRHFTDPATSATLDRVVQYRPLLPLTLSLDYALGAESVIGYHIGNLLLQIVASVLVYLLVLELLQYGSDPRFAPRRPGLIAVAVATLFAVHPVSGIGVNYVSARDLLLMQVFLTASLLAYVRMRRRGSTAVRWMAVLLLFALSMLSKQNGVVAPLLVLAFEFTTGKQRVTSAAPWLRALPFAAVIAAFFLYTHVVLGFSDTSNVLDGDTVPAWQYALTQSGLHLFHYFRNFIWPFPIRQAPLIEPAESLFDPRVLPGAAFIGATLVLAWRMRERMPLLAFSILAYWILMNPESSVLPLHHLAVDYRPYPASPFLFLAGALALDRTVVPRPLAGVIVTGAVVYAGTASYLLNRTWRTEESLWSHSVRYGGDALAHLNLAMSIEDRDDPRVRRNLEEALRLEPGYIVAHINLGLWLIDHAEPDAGLNHVRQAVASDPSRAQSHYWLAAACRRLGMTTEAAEASAAAAKLAPRNLSYLYQAAVDAQAVEDFAGSLEWIATLERLDPGYRELGFLKGFALRRLGRLDEAIVTYRAFLPAQPKHAQAQFNLGYALLIARRCDEAIPHFEAALSLNPDFHDAHLHLATCFEQIGDHAQASRHRMLYQR